MGKCMGLILRFRCKPTPRTLDIADDGLAPLVYVDVLDCDLLLPFAAMSVESLSEGCLWAPHSWRQSKTVPSESTICPK